MCDPVQYDQATNTVRGKGYALITAYRFWIVSALIFATLVLVYNLAVKEFPFGGRYSLGNTGYGLAIPASWEVPSGPLADIVPFFGHMSEGEKGFVEFMAMTPSEDTKEGGIQVETWNLPEQSHLTQGVGALAVDEVEALCAAMASYEKKENNPGAPLTPETWRCKRKTVAGTPLLLVEDDRMLEHGSYRRVFFLYERKKKTGFYFTFEAGASDELAYRTMGTLTGSRTTLK